MTSTVNAGADETALSLENLDTATEYTISVSAQYSESESEISQRNASTLALPPIGPLSFTEISDTSFVVNWQVPNNLPPSSYELTYWNQESDAVNLDGIKKTDVLIDGLDPATEYNVSVVAVYFETVESAPIHGNETTRNAIEGTCSCYTYLKSQERLEKTISQLVKQIEYLTHRIQPQLVPETLNHDTRT
uniref:Fibronectin type-III domain-containing protein n=1 Tax=Ciona savignyi TaxID=51511 RepID=H2ZR56_CIOSA